LIPLKIIFWILISVQLYLYFIYPGIITLVAKLKRKEKGSYTETFEPEVSIIITVRNEERVIEDKIKNTLQLEYPKEKLEIIVVSDHSTDKTDEIVKKYKEDGVHLIKLSKRLGKTEAQNLAAKQAKGKILVFSDANAMYKSDAIKYLIRHFEDSEVGCVSGELCYFIPDESIVGREENLYWRYEKFIKKQEARTGYLLGANGSIYAVRKSDYVLLEPDTISDFIEPLEIANKKRKVVYESKALSYEDASMSFNVEFVRRRRIVSRSIRSLIVHSELLNPFKTGMLAVELLSHKLLRWISPFFLILLFVVNGLLALWTTYCMIFYIQIGFYILGSVGLIFKDCKKIPVWIFIPYYFCLLNYGSLLGVIDFLRGKTITVWEPVRS